MIKKYNAFVEGKVNEEFVMAEPRPGTTEVSPGTIEKPGTMPEPPTPIKKDRTSPVPAPAKAELEPMEEEGSEYMGVQMLQNLADVLETEVVDNSVEYNDRKINFYSETEMFHVDKKKFKTVEEVVAYLKASEPDEEVEMTAGREEEIKTELDNIVNDDDNWNNENSFESKSYKSTRKFESFKNKKK